MRDRYEIKTEIDAVQEDLQNNLAQLRDVITEKVDVKGKLQHRLDEKKAQARAYAIRGRDLAIDYVAQARRLVREKPLVVAGVALGVIAIGGAVLAIRSQLPDPHDDEPVTTKDLRAALAQLRDGFS